MNKVERVRSVIEGKTADRPPVIMWFHFNKDLTVQEAAAAHFKFVKETDLDIIKVMYDNDYTLESPIGKASDWFHIKPQGRQSRYYQKQRDILRGLLEKSGGDYPLWVTMFGPFKFAVMAASDAMVMAHCKENPGAVKAGVSAIADTLAEWAEGYLEEGADAIFYSAQFGEEGRFSQEEWENLVSPYDLRVLQVAEERAGKYNALHLCGEPEYGYKVHIDWFGKYPGALVNWAVHPNSYSLERGRDFFARPIMGGLDNHGVMAHGTGEEVREAVEDLIRTHGRKGYMIGANCSIESPDHAWRIGTAVEAAKSYVF